METNKDFSIAGPGSPTSLKKFLGNFPDPDKVAGRNLASDFGVVTVTDEDEPLKPLTLLIDGSGCGIAKDAEDIVYITPEECKTQTLYYVKNIFNGKGIPAYLYRGISDIMKRCVDKQFESDQEMILYFKDKDMTQDKNYKYILNFITYAEHNQEAIQIIGLIQLFSGILSSAKKANKGVRIYFDRPETALHPNSQSNFISWMLKTSTEYGLPLSK